MSFQNLMKFFVAGFSNSFFYFYWLTRWHLDCSDWLQHLEGIWLLQTHSDLSLYLQFWFWVDLFYQEVNQWCNLIYLESSLLLGYCLDTDGKTMSFCIRWCAEMVVVGLLGLTNDVCTECFSCQWISWEELETCKHQFLKTDQRKTYKTTLANKYVEIFVS